MKNELRRERQMNINLFHYIVQFSTNVTLQDCVSHAEDFFYL